MRSKRTSEYFNLEKMHILHIMQVCVGCVGLHILLNLYSRTLALYTQLGCDTLILSGRLEMGTIAIVLS